MRTNIPYRGRTRLRLLHGLFTAALCLLLLPSCSGDEDSIAVTPQGGGDGLCEATLRLDISTFAQQKRVGVRSYVTGNDDEDRIKDIWVFQFNAETGKSLKTPVYLDDFDSNDIEVQLMLNEGGEQSIVCIVANTHEEGWALDELGNTKEELNTYDKLKAVSLPKKVSEPVRSSNLGDTGYQIPMFGVSKAMAIVSKCYVSIPLIRMFAKVDVYVDPSYPHELGMEIENIRILNIPYYCRIGALTPTDGDGEAATYPADTDWCTYDAGKLTELILYVPENLQGKVEGMDSKLTATAGFPEKALKVEVTVAYGDDKSKQHVYTVYPGLDMDNDFNVKRNYIYDVNINIKNLPE